MFRSRCGDMAARRTGPHLRPLRDGWRPLRRFMLLLSPTWLFQTQSSMLLGVIPLVALGTGPVSIVRLTFDYHYMIAGSLLTILGSQRWWMTGLFAKAYCHAAPVRR